MAKKSGRKRNTAAKRDKSGRISRAGWRDKGTTEVQARRAWLAQGGDPTMTEYPLGVLLANGAVTEAEHRAGCRYAWLYRVVVGRESSAAVQWDTTTRGRDLRDPEDPQYQEWLAAREREFASARSALDDLSRQHRDSVVNLCVYERLPGWMLPRFPTTREMMDAQRVKRGLEVLADVLRTKDRAEAGRTGEAA